MNASAALSQTVKNQPPNAIAIVGVDFSGGTNNSYGILTLGPILEGGNSNIVSLPLVRGSRSSFGIQPIEPGDTISLAISVNDPLSSSPVYSVWISFLIADTAAELATRPPSVPFKNSGAYDTDPLVQFEQTSAATTAQTLTLPTIGNLDELEIIAAWFQTNTPSTATGNAGYWDGTLRTDIDTTVAVASYVFNMGAKGQRPRISGGSTAISFRFVIGAPAAGTSTLYVIARPIAQR